jgi:hypothetical protein
MNDPMGILLAWLPVRVLFSEFSKCAQDNGVYANVARFGATPSDSLESAYELSGGTAFKRAVSQPKDALGYSSRLNDSLIAEPSLIRRLRGGSQSARQHKRNASM